MAKVRVRKDIAEQMTSKLKTPKKGPESANSVKKSTNFDNTGKLQANETIDKSLFTDWKVELHHICNKKGLDYDSVIQKYDDKLTRYVAEEQLHQDAENVIAYKAYKDLNKSLTYSGHK